jgi:hypothetical protein
MAQKKKWADLSPTQQKVIVVSGIVEVALTAYCLRDLRQRPADEVRGPKALWAPALSVQPFGPLAYLVLGRRSA